jgi:hypothetical protein
MLFGQYFFYEIKKHMMKNKQTHSSHTMASEQPEPWTPRWLREKLMESNNDLLPNDPNRDNKPSTGADPPLCKCKIVSLLL